MAKNPHYSTEARNVMLDALSALLNGGSLRIYDGAQPTDCQTAITTQNLLCTLTLGNPAFAAASGGSAVANAITSDTDIDLSGTAAWFRAVKSNGTSVVTDGSVGISNADAILAAVTLVQHAIAGATSWTLNIPA